jgi:enediyne polyketide synthase
MRDGITPISVDNGIAVLRRVLADPDAGPVLMVGGRAGGLPTLTLPESDLPLDRFVDQVVVHYQDIELITEAELSAGADQYLPDHLLEGDYLFPAVIGMEAMTQVAAALTGRTGSPLLEDVEFLRPIVVRPGSATTIRLAAQVRDADTVDVVIRSAETGFSADHFRASLRVPRGDIPGDDVVAEEIATPALPPVPVDPGAELYGEVLFQGKRFQRLQSYRRAAARHAVAELSTSSPAPWFAPFLPQRQLLADPGTRDAVMHAIQCCVPDATLLPQGIERLWLSQRGAQEAGYVVMDARERSQDGDSYVYDVDVHDPAGVLIERWEGLKLRAVRKKSGAGPWVPSLLSAYLERGLERVLGGSRAVVVEPDPADPATSDRRAQTALAVGRALNGPAEVRYRPDGRPETDGALISASHGAGVTLVVAGRHRLGCDVETVSARDERDWAALLGADQLPVRDLIVAEAGDNADLAGTRVWSAIECLRKVGATTQSLTVDPIGDDGWVVLSAGDARIATWVTTLNDYAEPVVFAVLSGEEG